MISQSHAKVCQQDVTINHRTIQKPHEKLTTQLNPLKTPLCFSQSQAVLHPSGFLWFWLISTNGCQKYHVLRRLYTVHVSQNSPLLGNSRKNQISDFEKKRKKARTHEHETLCIAKHSPLLLPTNFAALSVLFESLLLLLSLTDACELNTCSSHTQVIFLCYDTTKRSNFFYRKQQP